MSLIFVSSIKLHLGHSVDWWDPLKFARRFVILVLSLNIVLASSQLSSSRYFSRFIGAVLFLFLFCICLFPLISFCFGQLPWTTTSCRAPCSPRLGYIGGDGTSGQIKLYFNSDMGDALSSMNNQLEEFLENTCNYLYEMYRWI